jgi:hypothetical protein
VPFREVPAPAGDRSGDILLHGRPPRVDQIARVPDEGGRLRAKSIQGLDVPGVRRIGNGS